MILRNKGLGESYIAALAQYINANTDDWNNIVVPKTGVLNRDNTGKKTFWV